MTARYQRVPREEDGLSTETPRVDSPSEAVNPRLRRKQLMKGIDDKIHAVFWVGGAGAVIYFLDFFKVAFTDERVNRWVLRGGWDRIDAPCGDLRKGGVRVCDHKLALRGGERWG